ncbi:hypothetical protein Tco_0810204 [Tanacetum coccineum]
MVVKKEILDDFLRFLGVLIAKLAAGSTINFTFKMNGDMIIENLDLEPKIDAMMRDVLNLEVLPGGKNWARKRVVRSSQVEMDLAGRRSSPLLT